MSNIPNLGLPLTFMYEGYIYSKQVDGEYHIFPSTVPHLKANAIGNITMAKARELFATAKFISSIIVLTNNVNLKI